LLDRLNLEKTLRVLMRPQESLDPPTQPGVTATRLIQEGGHLLRRFVEGLLKKFLLGHCPDFCNRGAPSKPRRPSGFAVSKIRHNPPRLGPGRTTPPSTGQHDAASLRAPNAISTEKPNVKGHDISLL
jgi:hypothetical protein